MWRYALLGLTLLLPGCARFGDFLGDTFTYDTNPNRPVGDSVNMKRVQGRPPPVAVLVPEPGDVWPTGIATVPTLQELEKETNSGQAPAPIAPIEPFAPHGQPRPEGSSSPGGATTTSPTVQTPRGPAVPATSSGGLQQIPPSGTTPGGIVVPNGNGTSTLISPNGTVTTIPSPK